MKSSRGFSFVELLVALLLTGILMAGMATIFKSSLSSIYTNGELIGAQRRNRWVLDQMGDDLRMAGHTDGVDISKIAFPLVEQPFVITPGVSGSSQRDQIEMFMNANVQELTVAANSAIGDTQLTLSAPGGGPLNIQQGDFMIIKDGIQAEYGYANAAVSSGAVTLMNESDQQNNSVIAAYMKNGSTAFWRPHTTLTGSVTVLRPCRLVHYSIEDRSLDPSSTTMVPCLVRKEAAFGGGTQGNWGTITGDVVAENVSSLRVDLSIDGGQNWEHGATWTATVASANSRLPAANKINANAFWFKQIPALIRVEIRSRTPQARTEYSSTGTTAAYKERTQILVIAPRNFGSPL